MDAVTQAGYLAQAQTAAFRRRLVEAGAVVAAHPRHAVSVSWGKDSVAMLSIVARLRPAADVVFARYESPFEVLGDLDAVRDAVLARPDMRRLRYREIVVPGEWQMFERAGGAFIAAATPKEREALRWWREAFEARLSALRDSIGASGYLIGMRAAESRARAITVATRGMSYVTAAGRATALPLARWSGADVWARLVSCDLPYLAIYDAAPDRERERSDLTWAVGGSGEHLRRGAVASWRRAYPDQITAWLDHWPELRSLAHA